MRFPYWPHLQRFLPAAPFGRLLFFLLLGIGIFLRVAGLTWGIPDTGNQSSIYHDEGHVLSFVLKSHEDFKKDFGEYEIVRPVYLFHLLGRPLIAVGDALGLNNENTRIYEIGALRTVTAFFGIVGLLAIYALGKQVGSWKTGLWALAFLTFMPAHWYYSQILKGDLMVATLFTLILICAISLARTGSRQAYIWGALLLGAGTSFKTTTAMAAPVLLLAHLIFAWKQRQWSILFSGRAFLCLLLGAASFAVLYPYPFYNFEQYWYFIENPSLQHLSPRFLVSPAEYLAKLQQYHSPTRPFLEMIFGKFLLWSFLPALLVVGTVAVWQLKKSRRTELLLILALFVLFFHSLTFSDALDERYVLPFAPFAALFPALVITGFGFLQKRYQKNIGTAIGMLLVAGTAAITWVLFPPLAFRDPRQQVVDYIRSNAPAGSVIAQASQTSRWALVLDPEKYRSGSFLYGPEKDRHVALLSDPDYVIVQQEPWNYDHTFRYELAGIDIAKELDPFLARFEYKRTFGKVPTLFGMRLPQTLGTPVLHVYSSPQNVSLGQEKTLSTQASWSTQQGSSASLIASHQLASYENSYLRFTIKGKASIPETQEGEMYIGLAIQSSFTNPTPSRRLEEPEVEQTTSGPVLFYRLSAAELRKNPEISFVVHFPRADLVTFYRVIDGKTFHSGQGKINGRFSISLFSIMPEDTALPGTFHVEQIFLGKVAP